jgi:hypothetical protein
LCKHRVDDNTYNPDKPMIQNIGGQIWSVCMPLGDAPPPRGHIATQRPYRHPPEATPPPRGHTGGLVAVGRVGLWPSCLGLCSESAVGWVCCRLPLCHHAWTVGADGAIASMADQPRHDIVVVCSLSLPRVPHRCSCCIHASGISVNFSLV